MQREEADGAARDASPLLFQPLRWAAVLAVFSYYRTAYRIQGWGKIPNDGRPTLIVANHQHEVESSLLIANLSIGSFYWSYPIFTVSSRRMWEPGFLAERLPWLSPVLRTANLGALFGVLGMQPLENELSTRPFSSIAYTLIERHGDLPVAGVFGPASLGRLPASVTTLHDITKPRHFRIARSYVKLSEVTESYRKELIQIVRDQIETDLQHFEALQRSGATIFLAPEGFYTTDGKMLRLRGALTRLSPLADVWVAGISYDPFVGRRLSLMYRVERAVTGRPLDVQIKRTRPVTTSALLASWLVASRTESFTEAQAMDALGAAVRELPAVLFVDPELRRRPQTMVASAAEGLVRLGIASRSGETYHLNERRVHPHFPRTPDILVYLDNFHQETLEGGRCS